MKASDSHKHNLLPVAIDGHPNPTYACYGCDLVVEWDRTYGGWSKLQRNDAGFWQPTPSSGDELDQPQRTDDDLMKKLQQDIRDMFKLESQRNDLNFALSGVERGEMTLQDYEDDISLAVSQYVVLDIIPQYIAQHYISRETVETAIGSDEKCMAPGCGNEDPNCNNVVRNKLRQKLRHELNLEDTNAED